MRVVYRSTDRLAKKEKQPVYRGEPQIAIHPDVVFDHEWDEPDAHVWVGRQGWTWAIKWPDADKYVGVIVGEADTYEQALEDALTKVRSL